MALCWAAGAGCAENFNDIYIGPQGGAGGQSGAAGEAGAAGGPQAGAGGGCGAPRCQGKVREVCEGGAYKAEGTCLLGCAEGECLEAEGLAAGDAFSCARLSNSEVRCWGDNLFSQLGRATPNPQEPLPAVVPGADGSLALAAGGQHACALSAKGEVRCWGRNHRGQTGQDKASQTTPSPALLGLAGKARQAALGALHGCALLEDGRVFCWGDGELGQLGDGVAKAGYGSSVPVQVEGLPGGIAGIAAGGRRSCAFTAAGAVWCWGELEAQKASATPELRSDVSSVVGLGLSATHACALQGVGAIRCWGANDQGQLGNGSTDPSDVSVLVKNATSSVVGARSLALGAQHGCLTLEASLTAQCWGRGDEGQIGVKPTSTRASTLEGVAGVVEVAAGASHGCARSQDGQKVWCWGANQSGQLGQSRLSEKEAPALVGW